MKAEIHADNNRKVLFKDTSSGDMFLVYSTVKTDQKGTGEDGQEYDMYVTEISSASHPFYTGKETRLDRAGRAEKFRARQAKAQA
jgi:large subunit ribosomal protein L31